MLIKDLSLRLCCFFVSSFLLLSFVYADTIDLTDYDFSFVDDLPTLISTADNANISHYLIFRYPVNDSYRYISYHRSSVYYTYNVNNYVGLNTQSSYYNCFSSDMTGLSRSYCDFSGPTAYNFLQVSSILGGNNPYQLIYSKDSISWNYNLAPASQFTFTYNSDTFDYNPETDYLPTLNDLYIELASTPPVPVDQFPLLTSYYSLVIDKISLLCTYIANNYYILSIFVIFIFLFLIALVRRYS